MRRRLLQAAWRGRGGAALGETAAEAEARARPGRRGAHGGTRQSRRCRRWTRRPSASAANVILPGSVGAQLAPQPTSREDAASRIAAIAKYLRQSDPTSPAPYLLVRGFRWGELRASGRTPDPRLLEAPATQIRTQLKSLLLDGKWDALLEACENVMATPNGRGWLDLQRYALTRVRTAWLGVRQRCVVTAWGAALPARGFARARGHDADGRHADGERGDARLAQGRSSAQTGRRASGSFPVAATEAAHAARFQTRAAIAAVRAGVARSCDRVLMREVGQREDEARPVPAADAGRQHHGRGEPSAGRPADPRGAARARRGAQARGVGGGRGRRAAARAPLSLPREARRRLGTRGRRCICGSAASIRSRR